MAATIAKILFSMQVQPYPLVCAGENMGVADLCEQDKKNWNMSLLLHTHVLVRLPVCTRKKSCSKTDEHVFARDDRTIGKYELWICGFV